MKGKHIMERKFKVGSTTYQRCKKYGVGKEIGGKIYVHKKYAYKVIDPDVFFDAADQLPDDFTFNCLVVDNKKHIIRFDQAPDFDTEREPHPGDFIEVSLDTKRMRRGHSDYIWHHKWMWVDDDYEGFDVNESYKWSKKWTSIITHPSGIKYIWLNQISSIK